MLPRSLASVWAQRPALPAEVIVVDDGSADDTAEVASCHGATVIRHPENRGLAAARNSGVEAATQDWVAFLDSDDEWLPHHLAHLWGLRAGHALVGSSSLSCGEDERDDRFHGAVSRKPVVLHSPTRLIATYNMFTVSGAMIRRDVALELGGFRPVWGVEDMDLWVRVLERYTGICSPRVSVIYHVHGDQMSSRIREMQSGHRQVGESYRDRAESARVALERWDGVEAWDTMRLLLAEGDRRAALSSGAALVHGPQRIVGLVLLLWSRFLGRRRSASVDRDGNASVAVFLPDADRRRAVLAGAGSHALRDLSERSMLELLLTLARRPPGVLVVDSRRCAALARAAGVRVLSSRRALQQLA
jgi:glycosyltransferase involved in cell wall biosynthesis